MQITQKRNKLNPGSIAPTISGMETEWWLERGGGFSCEQPAQPQVTPETSERKPAQRAS